METEQNGAAFAGMSRHHRSRVTNRTKLFAVEGMDGRTGQARRYRDNLTQIECDVGGIDNLSEGQRQLCRRAATLSFTAECMEVDAVAGNAFDIDLFGQLTDRLGRCKFKRGPPNSGRKSANSQRLSRRPPSAFHHRSRNYIIRRTRQEN